MKILLVDDDPDVRKLAKFTLEVIGKHQTVMASSALEGIALATSEQPELILLDLMMPGMDGLAALAELRQNPALASIPVILMTASVHRFESNNYKDLGAAGVITKPFEPMSLTGEIQRIVDGL